jgi:hypothetical protein
VIATQLFFIPAIILPLPSVERVENNISLGPGDTGSVSVNCPSESVVVSGGFTTHPTILVYRHSIAGNGWIAYGKNNGGAVKKLYVSAVCLSHTSGSISNTYTDDTASGGGIGHPVATCPAGSVVTGGGWSINSDGSLVAYVSTKTGNGWEVFVDNNSGSTKTARAYAVCLSGTSGVINTISMNASLSGNSTGHAIATCPSGLNVGGGLRTSSSLYIYHTAQRFGFTDQWIVYGKNNSGSSQFLQADALCLSFQ